MSLYADKTHQNLGGGSFLAVRQVRYFCERIMWYIVVSGKFGGADIFVLVNFVAR